MWKITADNISQKFNQRLIFEKISFELESGHSLVLTGPNGSGKTTLIRIICQLLRPTSGNLKVFHQNHQLQSQEIYGRLGLVGPYLQLYNQLTAFENYTFFARIRRLPVDTARFRMLMDKLGLAGREFDELQTFSSGMMQRMKYVMAIMHQPEILILDEPTANLDEAGSDIVYQIMREQKKNKILILATNEPEEVKFGEKHISLVA